MSRRMMGKEKDKRAEKNTRIMTNRICRNAKSKRDDIKASQIGITLVALVITIVIIIILATVTINMAFGDNGLIKQAELARDMAANSTQYETQSMTNLTAYLNTVMGEDAEIDPPDPTLPTTVEEAKENETKYTDTTPITDDLGNTVYIPGGFHVDKESEGTLVEDGIVIEDDDGNQFVWIPTGAYNVTEEKDSDGTKDAKMTNELTRRQWATTANTVQEPTPISEDEVASGSSGAYYYGEGDSRSCTVSGDTNSIDAFLASAKPVAEGGHGGFYIGRYEQGTGNVCKAGVDAYVDVTRDEAKTKAEAMYSAKPEIKATSQLISSYAWDTALNFICQTNTEGYVLATTTDDSYGNIGTKNKTQTGGYPADCYSNVYDLLGNCYEWTTEYSSHTYSSYSYPCVIRGGLYSYSNIYAAVRDSHSTDGSSSDYSFRLQLYV